MTLAEIFEQHEAIEQQRAAAHAARRANYEARWAEHRANLHWCGHPAPVQIGACAPMSDYIESSALGRSTD